MLFFRVCRLCVCFFFVCALADISLKIWWTYYANDEKMCSHHTDTFPICEIVFQLYEHQIIWITSLKFTRILLERQWQPRIKLSTDCYYYHYVGNSYISSDWHCVYTVCLIFDRYWFSSIFLSRLFSLFLFTSAAAAAAVVTNYYL